MTASVHIVSGPMPQGKALVIKRDGTVLLPILFCPGTVAVDITLWEGCNITIEEVDDAEAKKLLAPNYTGLRAPSPD